MHPLQGLQTFPSFGSFTHFLLQQSLPNVQPVPSGAHVQLAPSGLQTFPRLGSSMQVFEQQSDEKLQERPSGTQVQEAPAGLQTFPALGSSTQFFEQQSLENLQTLPSGVHVQSPVGSALSASAGRNPQHRAATASARASERSRRRRSAVCDRATGNIIILMLAPPSPPLKPAPTLRDFRLHEWSFR